MFLEKKYYWHGKFYRVLNKDGTDRANYPEFKNSLEIGDINKASGWDPNTMADLGENIYVVEGHPFRMFEFSRVINDPIFLEVETTPNPPIRSWSKELPKCQKAKNIRILDFDSSELSYEAIYHFARTERDWQILGEIIKILDPEKHNDILVEIAEKNQDPLARRAATKRLDPDKDIDVLIRIAEKDVNWSVRIMPIEMLNPKKHIDLFRRISKKDKSNKIRLEALSALTR